MKGAGRGGAVARCVLAIGSAALLRFPTVVLTVAVIASVAAVVIRVGASLRDGDTRRARSGSGTRAGAGSNRDFADESNGCVARTGTARIPRAATGRSALTRGAGHGLCGRLSLSPMLLLLLWFLLLLLLLLEGVFAGLRKLVLVLVELEALFHGAAVLGLERRGAERFDVGLARVRGRLAKVSLALRVKFVEIGVEALKQREHGGGTGAETASRSRSRSRCGLGSRGLGSRGG